MSDDLMNGPFGTVFFATLLSWIGWLFWTVIFYVYDHLHWSWS